MEIPSADPLCVQCDTGIILHFPNRVRCGNCTRRRLLGFDSRSRRRTSASRRGVIDAHPSRGSREQILAAIPKRNEKSSQLLSPDRALGVGPGLRPRGLEKRQIRQKFDPVTRVRVVHWEDWRMFQNCQSMSQNIHSNNFVFREFTLTKKVLIFGNTVDEYHNNLILIKMSSKKNRTRFRFILNIGNTVLQFRSYNFGWKLHFNYIFKRKK